MKKIFSSFAALFVAVMMMAQTGNVLLGHPSTASSGTASAGNDGNTGSRWESASADPQWWQVDMESAQSFNTVQIVWEGAYAKTFTLSVSNDGTTWTEILSIADQALAGFPHTQTLSVGDQNARYLRFDGIQRGTPYGYSFWEIRAFDKQPDVLTTLNLSAPTLAKVGEPTELTIQTLNQYEEPMETEIVYDVVPAEAGAVVDGVYTAAAPGNATITATAGTLSKSVSIFAYASDCISQGKTIVAQSAGTNDAARVVDGNEGTEWQGCPTNTTDADEASRTYDSWFVLDLDTVYDIELVTIKFEGACSQEYHLDYASDDSVFTTAYTYTGKAEVNHHTDYLFSNTIDNRKVRYVRFYSTKAATQYGMKIWELRVFGNLWAATDTVAPQMVSAEVIATTGTSVTIAVEAIDTVGEIIAYRVADEANGINIKYPVADEITVTGLTEATTYHFSITAIDGNPNESEAIVVEATTRAHLTAPDEAAPAPAQEQIHVYALYSDAYQVYPVCNYHAAWGDATVMEAIQIGDDNVLKYSSLNWLGWELNPAIDVTNNDTLHIDIWVENDAQLGIVPIYGGTGLVTDDNQRKQAVLHGQMWNSFDIALPTELPNLNLTSIFQIKFDYATEGAVYFIDNVYFYGNGVVDIPAGIEQSAAIAAPQKVIRDGRVLIIRAGKAYDMMGRMAE